MLGISSRLMLGISSRPMLGISSSICYGLAVGLTGSRQTGPVDLAMCSVLVNWRASDTKPMRETPNETKQCTRRDRQSSVQEETENSVQEETDKAVYKKRQTKQCTRRDRQNRVQEETDKLVNSNIVSCCDGYTMHPETRPFLCSPWHDYECLGTE